MDIKKIEDELNITDLNSYIVNVIKTSRTTAENEIDNLISLLIKKVNDTESTNDNLKNYMLINDLIHFKKMIYEREHTNFSYYLKNYKKYKSKNLPSSLSIINEIDEDIKLANFIIESISFLESNHFTNSNKIKNLNDEVLNYFLNYNVELKSNLLFEELNRLNFLPNFKWTLNSLDFGIIELYKNLISEYELSINRNDIEFNFQLDKKELQIDTLKGEIISLKREISHTNSDLEHKINTIKFYEEYHKKYLQNYPVYIVDTYFGDNMPFLINLYNFLVKNQYLKMCSWSYFYSCMTINNNEVIFLQNYIKLKFVGRIFFNLKFFLIPNYIKASEAFFMSKFYIDEKPINSSFFKNHVNITIDKTLYSELERIDAFFDQQSKLYIKSKR